VSGLWLLQECQRAWAEQGRASDPDTLVAAALAAPPLAALFDPDHPTLAEFGDMPARIRSLCTRPGQTPPESDAAITRAILESLALKYRHVIETLESLTGPVRTIHIVGGGVNNAALCQFSADACNRPVLAGPIEATAAGNAMTQALARRRVGSLADIRAVIAASFKPTRYEPRQRSAWADAYARFTTACRL
jgi:rhamnulokinase